MINRQPLVLDHSSRTILRSVTITINIQSPEVILAGTDRIAIDAAGVALLRYFGCQTEAARGKIFEQEQIARAVELGLGVDRPEKIEFLTGDADSKDYSEIIKEVLTAG